MRKTYNAKLAPMEGKSEIQQQVTHPENVQVVTPEWLESYTGNNWQAQRLVITDETPYQDIRGGYVLCPDGVSVVNVVGFDTDIKMYWCAVSGAKCFIDGSDYKKVIATYPAIPDVPQIDLSDIHRWIDEGCKESVELEVERDAPAGTKVFNLPKDAKYKPTTTNNTVKMVWGEQDKAKPISGEVHSIDWEKAKLDFGFHAKAICKNEINATKVIDWIKQYYQFPFKNELTK